MSQTSFHLEANCSDGWHLLYSPYLRLSMPRDVNSAYALCLRHNPYKSLKIRLINFAGQLFNTRQSRNFFCTNASPSSMLFRAFFIVTTAELAGLAYGFTTN